MGSDTRITCCELLMRMYSFIVLDDINTCNVFSTLNTIMNAESLCWFFFFFAVPSVPSAPHHKTLTPDLT